MDDDMGDVPAYVSTHINFQSEDQYSAYLSGKIEKITETFTPLINGKEIEIFKSTPSHYRLRCRFGLCRKDGKISFNMWDKDENGKSITVPFTHFPLASRRINALLPLLLEQIQTDPEIWQNLRTMFFHDTFSQEHMLVTFTYNKPLNPTWFEKGKKIAAALNIFLIGRSKKVKYITHQDFVVDSFVLNDGRKLMYKQVEGSFSNPNGSMCLHTLNFLCSVCEQIQIENKNETDLLELYCGNGNHTCAVARYWRQVLAVEINQKLTDAGALNLKMNKVENAFIYCSPSEKFCREILKQKKFNFEREMETEDKEKVSFQSVEYQFSAVLVDPPRCGLDRITLNLVQQYNHIIYISCSPESLLRDITQLVQTHQVERFCLLDHFPYTGHTECGTYLKRKPEIK